MHVSQSSQQLPIGEMDPAFFLLEQRSAYYMSLCLATFTNIPLGKIAEIKSQLFSGHSNNNQSFEKSS